MIINNIDEINRKLNRLKLQEKEKDNLETLRHYQMQFQEIVTNIQTLIDNMDFAKAAFGFEVDSDLYKKILSLAIKLDQVSNVNELSDSLLSQSMKDCYSIKKELNKQWFSFKSKQLLVNIQSTLNIVKAMDQDQVTSYLNNLNKAKNFDVTLDELKQFKQTIDDSKAFIESLRIKPEVVDFLTKINNGRARLGDLNDDVIQWIKENNLERKIKISF